MAMDQDDIDKLSKELIDFTKGLNEFGNKAFKKGDTANPSATPSNAGQKASTDFDKSTQKIVNALALLSVNLTKASATEKEKKKYLDEFNLAVVKSTRLQEYNAESLAKQRREGEKADAEDKRNRLTAERAAESVEDTAKRYAKAFGASSKAFGLSVWQNARALAQGQEEEFKTKEQYVTRIADLFSSGITGVTRFSTGLISGADSFQSLNSVVSILGKGLGGLVGLIPFIGTGLSKLSEAGTEVAKTMIDQFSSNLKSFKELADIGLASSFSDMQKTAKETGLLYADINKSLGKYTVNLAQFGGSVSGGKKIFSELSKEMEPFRQEFRAMGISTQEFAEYQAMYLAREGKLGLVKDKDAKQLSEGTKKYIDELDVLTKLTGEDRKAIQKKMDESMAESQYAANMELLKNNPKATGDLRAFDILMRKEFGDEFAKGMRNNLGGTPTTESGNVAFMQTGGEAVRVQQMLQDGTIDLVDAIGLIKKSVRDTLGTGTGAANLVGITGDLAGTPYSNFAKMLEGMNAKDLKKEDIEEIKKAIADAKAKSKDLKTIEGAAANAQEQIYKSAIKLQDAFSNPRGLTAMVGFAAEAVKKFGDAAEEVIKRFGGESTPSKLPPAKLSDRVSTPQTIKTGITENLGDVKAAMMKRGEKDENYLTATLANIMKETGGANKPEDLSGYAKTDNLKIREIFGNRVKGMSDSQLNSVKANEQTFAETIYGGEYGRKNLGNIEPGDGWKYRGRGYVQLTGKANYAAASQAIFGDDTLVKDPDLITQNSNVAAEVTAWFMERGKTKLAKTLGISENKTTRDEAALLATSVIANRDARDAGPHIQKKLESVMGSMNSKELSNIVPTGGAPTINPAQTSMKKDIPSWLPKKPINTESEKTSSMVKSKDEALALLNFDNKGTGQRENFLSLSSDIQEKVLAAGKEYNELTGLKLQVNSARRSFEEQDKLRKDWESGKSKIYAAPAGTSDHETGRAIDIQQGMNGDTAAITALNRQGLTQAVQGDPVHFQAKTGGVFKGPSTGYNVELHGEEMVIPAGEGVSKQPLNTGLFAQDESGVKDLVALMERMNDKYDQMIDLLTASVDNSDKLVAATA